MPNAKFVLSTRNSSAWATSIANHGNPIKLLQRMRDNTVPGLPVGQPRDRGELVQWQQQFYATVRHTFRDKPAQLFEYDIETLEPTRLAEFLDLPAEVVRQADELWSNSKSNVNTKLHPRPSRSL